MKLGDGKVVKDFRREAYWLLEGYKQANTFILQCPLILIHYWGDDVVLASEPVPLQQTRLKIRTMPSVLRAVEKDVQAKSSHIVYKEKVVEQTNQNEATSKPRNLKQVQNLRERVKNQMRITKDAIINIHGLAHDDPSYIHLIQTWPDLLVVFGLRETIDQTLNLIKLGDEALYFTYDTTFTLGDFYLSILLVRNIIFESMPALPVLFLLHKKKLTHTHSIFFEQFSKLFPNHRNIPIVVDDEVAINKAILDKTNLYLLGCWRHLGKSVERWVAGAGGSKKEQSFYREEVYELFRLPSVNEFRRELATKSQRWSKPFIDYYDQSIKPKSERFGFWVIRGHAPLDPKTVTLVKWSRHWCFLSDHKASV